MDWKEKIADMGACQDALDWLANYSTPQEAWERCDQIEWMLFVLSFEDERKWSLLSCLFVRTVIGFLTGKHRESAESIVETIESWSLGEISLDRSELIRLRSEAWDMFLESGVASVSRGLVSKAMIEAVGSAMTDAFCGEHVACAAEFVNRAAAYSFATYRHEESWSIAYMSHEKNLCDLLRSAVACPYMKEEK